MFQNLNIKKCGNTYMSAILLLGIRTASRRIFGCGKTNAHIGDTEYVSYCDVFQNLMYLSSKNIKNTNINSHLIQSCTVNNEPLCVQRPNFRLAIFSIEIKHNKIQHFHK